MIKAQRWVRDQWLPGITEKANWEEVVAIKGQNEVSFWRQKYSVSQHISVSILVMILYYSVARCYHWGKRLFLTTFNYKIQIWKTSRVSKQTIPCVLSKMYDFLITVYSTYSQLVTEQSELTNIINPCCAHNQPQFINCVWFKTQSAFPPDLLIN